MKKTNTLLVLTLGACLAMSAQAQNKREYHEMAYDSGCKSCHDQGMKAFPSDKSCLQCHDMAELAEQTKRGARCQTKPSRQYALRPGSPLYGVPWRTYTEEGYLYGLP